MKLFLLSSALLLMTATGYGFEGTFEAPSLVPQNIQQVKFSVYNYAVTRGSKDPDCGSKECYRVAVFLNDIHVGTWPTSPGKPNPNNKKHVGSYTPLYDGRPIHTVLGRDYVSWRRRYPMPYAMFISSLDGEITDYAFHTGYDVNGERLSKGCLRLFPDHARDANRWVREARKNGGNGYVWSKHTKDVYL